QPEPPLGDWPLLPAPEPPVVRTPESRPAPAAATAPAQGPALGWLAAAGPWPLELYEAVCARWGGDALRTALAQGRAAVEGGQIRATLPAGDPAPPPADLLVHLAQAAPEAALALALATRTDWPAGLAARAADG